MPREFELIIFQFECDTLAYWIICNTLFYMWQSFRGRARGFLRTCVWGRDILKLCRPLDVVLSAYELEPANISSSTFPF